MIDELAARPRIDRLHDLLPSVIRRHDLAQGEPLRALLQVIAEQADLLEEDLQQLYDNWFIETCAPWVVPYIADLIGHQPIREAAPPGDARGLSARLAALLPRREVARTLRARRRKGTLALLEDMARDVAGWPACAVEFGRLLAQTQSLRLAQPARGRSVDLRDAGRLHQLGSAFDALAHLPDLRRLSSDRTPGRFAPANVGVFVWRLKATSVTRSPAACQDGRPNCYTFSVLGNDVPLFNRPGEPEGRCATMRAPALPQPIDRRAFAAAMQPGARFASASPDHVPRSLAIWAPGWPHGRVDGAEPIAAARIIAADLSGWVYMPPRDHVAVDPVLGRIAFPAGQRPQRGVTVSYLYGASADLGGGEYTRPLRQRVDAQLIRVTGTDALAEALKPWRRPPGHPRPGAVAPQPRHAIIELGDSDAYVLSPQIHLEAGHTLQLRAAQRTRPVLRIVDWQTDRPDSMLVQGENGSRFTLDGLTIAGRGVQVQGPLASFTVRHSTLVPGWTLAPHCEPRQPVEPSIELVDSGACIVIEHSIVGAIQVNNDEVRTDPVTLRISDSIVDATGGDGDRPQCEAIGASGSRLAFAAAHIARSTVIGRVMTHALALAVDSLFMGRVTVARRQLGCMRFCYVTPDSRTPRRFHCQPDGVDEAVQRSGRANGVAADVVDAARQEERQRVRPRFDSLRYGAPTYGRLAQTCAAEIVRGAEDESEMGVYHDLFQPQRTANLRQRLDEFSPAGADTGILFAT